MTERIITDSSKINLKDWELFVQKHPGGNIFQSPHIIEVYNKTKNFQPITIFVLDKNDSITGLLIAVIQKEYAGLIGKLSARIIIYGGPLILNNNLEVLNLLLNEYNRITKSKGLYSQFRNFFDTTALRGTFQKSGFTYEEHLDILIRLNVEVGELVESIHKSRRRNLVKSTNKGVEFIELQTIEQLLSGIELIRDTYKRVKLPCPGDSLFQNAFNTLYPKGHLKCFAATLEGKMIGIRLILVYDKLLYDWYAGSNHEERNKYPNDFLIYNVLLWGQKNGYSVFDFGGAGKPNEEYGVREHKKQFGGTFVNFGRYEKIHHKMLYQVGLMGYKVWKKVKF